MMSRRGAAEQGVFASNGSTIGYSALKHATLNLDPKLMWPGTVVRPCLQVPFLGGLNAIKPYELKTLNPGIQIAQCR